VAKALGHVAKSTNCVSKSEQMVKHAIPYLVVKTIEQYVMLVLDSCVTATT
jgi:c-di-GMP-related signal transduction protein